MKETFIISKERAKVLCDEFVSVNLLKVNDPNPNKLGFGITGETLDTIEETLRNNSSGNYSEITTRIFQMTIIELIKDKLKMQYNENDKESGFMEYVAYLSYIILNVTDLETSFKIDRKLLFT